MHTSWLIAAALTASACTSSQAKIVKHLGIGLTAQGGAIGLVSQVTRDPGDSRFDALLTAAPLLVPGAAMWIVGYIRDRE